MDESTTEVIGFARHVSSSGYSSPLQCLSQKVFYSLAEPLSTNG